MRAPAFVILASLTAVAAEAQHTGKRDELQAVAACQAMRDHLLQQAEALVGSGALEGHAAQPFLSATTLLGRHCPQGYPQRVANAAANSCITGWSAIAQSTCRVMPAACPCAS
jgi:hypothetical protein